LFEPLIVTEPVYVPALRPLIFTPTFRVAGAEPEVEFNSIQVCNTKVIMSYLGKVKMS
jgi:hypothetical protein